MAAHANQARIGHVDMTKADAAVARWSADVVDFAIENKVCLYVYLCLCLSLSLSLSLCCYVSVWVFGCLCLFLFLSLSVDFAIDNKAGLPHVQGSTHSIRVSDGRSVSVRNSCASSGVRIVVYSRCAQRGTDVLGVRSDRGALCQMCLLLAIDKRNGRQ